MTENQDDWVRLPGLFRWEEVSDVFQADTGYDDQWHFDVRLVSERSHEGETLYTVRAAHGRARSDRNPSGARKNGRRKRWHKGVLEIEIEASAGRGRRIAVRESSQW